MGTDANSMHRENGTNSMSYLIEQVQDEEKEIKVDLL